MHCERATEMMGARLDEYLDRTESSQLEDHLEQCSACQDAWRRMQALDELFQSARTSEAPPHLYVGVTARIERREQARRAIVGSLVLAVGATALSLLILAPLTLGLLDNLGVASALLTGGLETAAQLLALFDTLSRTVVIMLDQFTVPLIIVSVGSLTAALLLNGLWILMLRKLYAVRR